MNRARKGPISSHWFGRFAVALYAIAQVSLVLAACTEGRFGADAHSHVEVAGTSSHHAHDEGGCAACSARALLSSADRAQQSPILAVDNGAASVSQIDARFDRLALAAARPRAPPVRQA